jgi:hypothetical protein
MLLGDMARKQHGNWSLEYCFHSFHAAAKIHKLFLCANTSRMVKKLSCKSVVNYSVIDTSGVYGETMKNAGNDMMSYTLRVIR